MARPREERIKEVRNILSDKVAPTCSALHYSDMNIPYFVNWLNENRYFDAPASIHHHGTQTGDLFEHSLKVAEILADYTEKGLVEWQRPCSPWIVGLFHDLCKMDDYVPCSLNDILADPINNSGGWRINPEPLLTGHGDKSIMMLSPFLTLSDEEVLCIRYHMGAYETNDWKQYDLAIRKYPSVLYTHTADMAASKVFDI